MISDDAEPEDNERLMIGLVNTEGGSRILPSSDTVTIVIQANDNVAGRVGFHPASRSVVAREGGRPVCSMFDLLNLFYCPCHLRGASLDRGGSNGRQQQVATEASVVIRARARTVPRAFHVAWCIVWSGSSPPRS